MNQGENYDVNWRVACLLDREHKKTHFVRHYAIKTFGFATPFTGRDEGEVS